MKEDFLLSHNHLPAVNMPEGRKNQAIFFSSRLLSLFRSLSNALVSEVPSLKIPQKYSTGTSGSGSIITIWPFTTFKSNFCFGFMPRASLTFFGITNCPFDDRVDIGISYLYLLVLPYYISITILHCLSNSQIVLVP